MGLNQISGACHGTCGDGNHNGNIYDSFVAAIDPNGPGQTSVSLAPTSLNFIANNLTIPQLVTLTNAGDDDLIITDIAVTGQNSGDYDQANDCPFDAPIHPGQFCQITVSFSPTGSGTRTAALTITDDALHSPQMVPLTGVGVGGKVRLR